MVTHSSRPAASTQVHVDFDWGAPGLDRLRGSCDLLIIVDVLSFSTSVEIAVSCGATIYPCQKRDEAAAELARRLEGHLAGSRRHGTSAYSLSPFSLLGIPQGTRLVLPSPNGATLSLATEGLPTLSGCLRNAEAVARAATRLGKRVGVLAAGERWPDGSLRLALEDALGAGAIIHALRGQKTPDAESVAAIFRGLRRGLASILRECPSGHELIERGFDRDIDLAGELNRSDTVPVLRECLYYTALEDE